MIVVYPLDGHPSPGLTSVFHSSYHPMITCGINKSRAENEI